MILQVFSGCDYYPKGGAEDFIGLAASEVEAVDLAKSVCRGKYAPWANALRADGSVMEIDVSDVEGDERWTC